MYRLPPTGKKLVSLSLFHLALSLISKQTHLLLNEGMADSELFFTIADNSLLTHFMT